MLMRGLPPWRTWRGGYHHDEEEDLLLGQRTPQGGCPLLPYKNPPVSSKLHTHWFFLSPAKLLPQNPSWLSEALPDCQFEFHTLGEVCVGVSGRSLLLLPRWTEDVEESTMSCTCDRARGRCRLWRRVHDLVIVKWTTMLTTSSEWLSRLYVSSSTLHRQHLCGNVIPASGHRGLVSIATISSSFLASLCFLV
jgi:hypothetical protein